MDHETKTHRRIQNTDILGRHNLHFVQGRSEQFHHSHQIRGHKGCTHRPAKTLLRRRARRWGTTVFSKPDYRKPASETPLKQKIPHTTNRTGWTTMVSIKMVWLRCKGRLVVLHERSGRYQILKMGQVLFHP